MPLSEDIDAILRRADSDLDRAALDLARVTAEKDEARFDATHWEQEYDVLLAKHDAHMATHQPDPDPEPPTSRLLFGGSYGGADESQYKGRAQAARIFFTGNLPTNIPATSHFQQAYRDGVRNFAISWKGSQSAVEVGRALESLPDDVTTWGTYFHEPEDNIADGTLSLADWRTRTTAQAAVMRDLGIIPTSILMSYTLNPKSDRNPEDYYLNGAIQCWGQDYYMNPLKGKDDPEGAVDKIIRHMRESGAEHSGIFETGVPNVNPEAVQLALIKRLRTKLLATPEMRLALFWSTNEFKLTPATADAWFG